MTTKKLFLAAILALAPLAALAQPGPGPAPSPWVVNGPQISYSQGCVTIPVTVTGGCKGAGTINVGGFYVNGASVAGGVSSVFGRTGAVTATSGDYAVGQVTGAAPIASPTFTGTVTIPNGGILGTPASGNAVNMTGYTVGNLAGLGAGVGTFLATPSSTNLRTAMTDETGTGSAVFANGPTLIAPVLGTPASGDASNLINIPVANATGVLPAANGGAGAITGILYANGSGLNSALTIGSGLSLVGSTLSATGSGVTITPTSGNVANDLVCMQNTTTVIQDCGFSSSAIPTSKLATTLNVKTAAYTLATTDAGKINYLNSASPFTFTVPTGATLGAGFATDIGNANTGLLTSTLASGTWADTGNASITTVQGQELFAWVGAANNVHSWLSMPPIAQDSILGNASAFDYPKAMALPSTCANDGAHAAIYTSHAWSCAAITGGVASSVAVGTTTITGGTSGRVEYNNAGVLGEMTTTGSGTVLALATSPVFTTPNIGAATGTQLDLSGTGTSFISLGTSGAIKVGATAKISFSGGSILPQAFTAWSAAGAGISTSTSGTSPSLQPNWSASGTTGIGSSGANLMDFIANATDVARVASTGMSMVAGVFTLKGFTVATLPAAPATGSMAYVTDANAACTYGGTATGGGSTFCKVAYNGAAWVEN